MMQSVPFRRAGPEHVPPPRDAWEEVRRCRNKRLSGEDKLAWSFLWHETEQGAREILTTAADVGYDQGTSGDAGLDRLKKLNALGFFAVRDGNKKGTYKIAALDPFAALEGLRLNGKKDPQTVLGFADQITPLPPSSEADRSGSAGVFGSGLTPGCGGDLKEDPPEEVPEEVPEVPPEDPRRPFRSSENEESQSPSLIFGRSSPFSQKLASREDTEEGRRGSSGTSSGTSEDAEIAELQRIIAARQAELNRSRPEKPMQERMAASTAKLPSPVQQTAAAEQRAALIFQAVACSNMRMAPCVRMAWHVVEGRIVWSKLATLFKALNDCEREGRLNVPRSVYANKGFDRICRECGVDLPPRKTKPR